MGCVQPGRLGVRWLGRVPYGEAYRMQLRLLEARSGGRIPDQLLLLEHPPVVTIGRSGSGENIPGGIARLEEGGIEVRETDRGGDVTYHGPGQLVGYPILDLREHRKDLHWLVRGYEQVFIDLLSDFGLEGGRIAGLPGVWVDGEKILAVGIRVRRWITMHGFALNVCPNMDHFRLIIPCGLEGRGVTSLHRLLPGGERPDMMSVVKDVTGHFGRVFRLDPVENWEHTRNVHHVVQPGTSCARPGIS